MDEFSLIDKIKAKLARTDARVIVGIGDDAAVLVPPKKHLITTTDCLVETIHFDLKISSPEEIGHKALAVNLSDVAAMGGTPLYALVSLGIREGISEEFILKLYDGMKNLAGMFQVAIVGGNITKSPNQFFVDITLIGEAEKYWRRQGAKEGDIIAVTGKLGGSSVGLALLKKCGLSAKTEFPTLTANYLMPVPRVLEAKKLIQLDAVTSAIDVSDGLSSELNHLAKASNVGMEIEENLIPFASHLEEACEVIGKKPLEHALDGGEDYELLLTLTPKKWQAAVNEVRSLGTKLTQIGMVSAKFHGVKIKNPLGSSTILQSRGWTHL